MRNAMGVDPSCVPNLHPLEKMWGYNIMLYGLPPARGAELATIQKDVTALHPIIPLREKKY